MSTFQVVYKQKPLTVTSHKVGDVTVYMVALDGKTLTLTKATRQEGHPFWTSIPEGRLKEAEAIGKLIDETLQKGLSLF